MKRLFASLLLSAIWLSAQAPEKVTVPLTDPGRPVRVRAQLIAGGITVHGYDGKEVLIESRFRPDGEAHRLAVSNGGMRRLEMPGNAGLDVMEENNIVNIHTDSMNRPVDLIISVPRRASLELKCLNDGNILVDHVDGEIDADDLNGGVTLKDISGSAVAHSLNAAVTVTFDRVDESKPMSFSTMNGGIDVTLPAQTRASLRMRTDHGEIFSDFDVKLDPSGSVKSEPERQKDGTYHLRFDRTVRGTINGGGPEYQFTSFQGQIFIRKK